jgi:hypothetical protein
MQHKSSVTAPTVFDGNQAGVRLIQGTLLKFVDGRWTARDGTILKPDAQYLVVSITQALQCWQGGMPSDTVIKTPGEPLPDVDEMNEKIDVKDWETGLDGRPKPPWVHLYVAYLVNVETGDSYTFANSTTGARICVDKLNSQVHTMRLLRGRPVVPVVKLGAREMKTQFGVKMRPHFEVVDWRALGDGGGELAPPASPPPSLPPAKATAKAGKKVVSVVDDDLNDPLPLHMAG